MRHRAINEDQLARAIDQQKKKGGDVGRILVDMGYVTEELLLRAQAHQLGIPLVDPVKNPPPEELTACMTAIVAERFKVIPVGGNAQNRLLRIATSAPNDAEAIAEIARMTGYKIELAAATTKSILQAIQVAYHGFEIQPEAEPPPEEIPEVEPEPDARHELEELRKRQLLSNQQYAAALARIERLEQIAENDHHALNVLGQVLLESGAITREELKRRLARQ